MQKPARFDGYIPLDNVVASATDFAIRAHAGQFRKGGDVPYVVHPLRVAAKAREIGMGDGIQAVAILHDVLEECPDIAVQHLKRHFPMEVVKGVVTLTKWWGESIREPNAAQYKERYYREIAQNNWATMVKLLDRADNLWDIMASGDMKWLTKYYTKTVQEFEPLVKAVTVPEVRKFFLDTLREVRAKASITGGEPLFALEHYPTPIESNAEFYKNLGTQREQDQARR